MGRVGVVGREQWGWRQRVTHGPMSGSEGRDFLCRRVGQGRRRVGERSGQGRAEQGRVVEAVLVVVRTACWDQSGPHPAPPRTHTLTLLPACLPSQLPRPAALLLPRHAHHARCRRHAEARPCTASTLPLAITHTCHRPECKKHSFPSSPASLPFLPHHCHSLPPPPTFLAVSLPRARQGGCCARRGVMR